MFKSEAPTCQRNSMLSAAPTYEPHARFFLAAVTSLTNASDLRGVRFLDVGCGKGQLVEAMLRVGVDAYGCDLTIDPEVPSMAAGRLKPIDTDPYRLPFDDETFPVVLSTSVLEHVKEKISFFKEIHRVLTPGGIALHLFPSKWYLPYEPHLFVPLANYFWPRCPRWWLWIWAVLGVRNSFQRLMSPKDVIIANEQYLAAGVSYLSTSEYERLSRAVFGNVTWPMCFYIEHAPGNVAAICRHLPFKGIFSLAVRELRESFLLQRKKTAQGVA